LSNTRKNDMENVLITGATGFIGSHTAELLLKQDYRVFGIIRDSSRAKALPDGVESVVCPLFEPDSIIDLLKNADYFVHIAGLTKALNRKDFYNVNAESTKIWLKSLSIHSTHLKKFVLISSQAATRPSSEPIDETVEPTPLTDYGKSKILAEKYAKNFMDKIPITIIRPPAVFGPRDKDIFFYFKLASKGILPLVGDPDRKFSAIYVEDLASAILLAMVNPKSAGEIFFVTDGEIHTWREFAEQVGSAIDRKKIKIHLPGISLWVAAFFDEIFSFILRKPALLSFQKIPELLSPWVADSSKIENMLGFKPKYDLKAAVAKTTKWYRDNGWIHR